MGYLARSTLRAVIFAFLVLSFPVQVSADETAKGEPKKPEGHTDSKTDSTKSSSSSKATAKTEMLIIDCFLNPRRNEDGLNTLKKIYGASAVKVHRLVPALRKRGHISVGDDGIATSGTDEEREKAVIEEIEAAIKEHDPERVAINCHGGNGKWDEKSKSPEYLVAEQIESGDKMKTLFIARMNQIWPKIKDKMKDKKNALLLMDTCHAGLIKNVAESKECKQGIGVCAVCSADCAALDWTFSKQMEDAYASCDKIDISPKDGNVSVGEMSAWVKDKNIAAKTKRDEKRKEEDADAAKYLSKQTEEVENGIASGIKGLGGWAELKKRLSEEKAAKPLIEKMDAFIGEMKKMLKEKSSEGDGLLKKAFLSADEFIHQTASAAATAGDDVRFRSNLDDEQLNRTKAEARTETRSWNHSIRLKAAKVFGNNVTAILTGAANRSSRSRSSDQMVYEAAAGIVKLVSAMQENIGSRSNLIRGSEIYNGCPLFFREEQSKDHVLFQCPASGKSKSESEVKSK